MDRNRRNVSSLHKNKDQSSMAEWFRKEFDEEVQANGFRHGSTSLLIVGDERTYDDAEIAVACLDRVNEKVYRTCPHEIIRRMDSKYALSNEDLDAQWEEAECVWVFDLFDEECYSTLLQTDIGTLVWWLIEAIRSNICLVVVCNTKNPDLDLYGVSFGSIIAKHLEVITNGKATQKPKKRRNPISTDGN